MKKLLALVLALVMTLGLATVGTNAAYADEKDINYKEAVDVLSAVGILKGDENGFRPGETLKRSEGAKIIAYLLAGNESAEAMVGTNKFSDVPASHWAAGYIDYLASDNVKVISGVGNGKFDPDGTLTTNQFTKMLLVALGFDASIEGLTGPDWAINTQRLANLASVDLFDGNDSAKGNEAIKREEAALYTFNTLCTPLVTYDSKGTELAVNGATINFGSSQWKYDVEQGGTNKNATNIYNDRVWLASAGAQVPLIEFAEKYYTNLKLVGNGDGVDDLGRPMRKWTWYNSEIGKYTKSNELVKTWTAKVTAKAVYDELGKAVYDSFHNAVTNGTSNGLSQGSWLKVYEDGINQRTTNPANQDTGNVLNDAIGLVAAANAAITAAGQTAVEGYINKTNTNKLNNSGNGTVTEVYMDDQNNVTLVTYHTYLFEAAGDYTSSTKTLNIVAGDDVETVVLKDYKVKLDDFPQIADYKDGDYLLVTVAKTSATQYEIQSIDKAEVVSGKVTTYDTGANQSVTLDGTLYKYSNKVTTDLKNTTFSVGQTAKLVVDKYGYVIGIDEALESSDYVFVINWGASSGLGGDARAKVVFADGTDGEITVKQAWDYAAGAAATDVTSKGTIYGWRNTGTIFAPLGADRNTMKWYAFSKNSAGEYSLYKAESKYTQDDVAFTSGAAMAEATVAYNNKAKFLATALPTGASAFTETTAGIANKLLADDKTIAITRNSDDDYSVYSGVKNMPEILLKDNTPASRAHVNAYALHKSNGYTSLVFFYADGNGTTVSGGEGENLIYVIDYQTKTVGADSKVWYTYKTLEGTEEVKVQADKLINNKNGDVYHAAFYASKNADGQLTNFRTVDAANLGGISKGTVYGAETAKNQVLYSGSTISVGGQSFTVNNNTKATLVSLKSANAMNSDAAADYEVFAGQGSAGARQIAALMENYTYTYDWAVKCTSKDSMIAEQIYVTVSAVNLATGDNTAAVQAALDSAAASIGTGTETYVIGSGKTLKLTKNGTINGDLVIRGTVDYGAFNLTVTGTIYNYSSNTLKGSGVLTAKGLVNDGTINATGAVTVSGNVDLVGGDATFAGGLTTTAGGNVNITSAGRTDLTAGATIAGNLTIAAAGETDLGAVTVTGDMKVTKATDDGKVVGTGAVTAGSYDIADGTTSTTTGTVGSQSGTNIHTEGKTTDTGKIYTVAADTSIIALTIV